jgi:hypothetical protein
MISVNVRACAADNTESAEPGRRALLSSGLALGAASLLPLASPAPAHANRVLSSDWEQVMNCC